MNVIGNENCKLYQELTTTPRYGIRLTCPGCSGEEFYIYRNSINTPALIDDLNCDNDDDNNNNNNNNNNSKLYEMVECKNSKCQIATQTFALKVKYREDKSQDFEIMGKQIVINIFECGE
jgi:hypothetical protein